MPGRVEIRKDAGGIYFQLVGNDGQTPLLESRRYRTLCPVEDAIVRLEGTVQNPKRWFLSPDRGGKAKLVGKGATGVEFVASVEGRISPGATKADVRTFLARCQAALTNARHVDVRPKRSRPKDDVGHCGI